MIREKVFSGGDRLRYSIKYLLACLCFLTSHLAYSLNVDIGVDNSTVAPRNLFYFKTVVSNTDAVARTDVTLTLDVPTGVFLQESSTLPLLDTSSCSFSSCTPGETPTWNLGTLSPGESKVISAIYTVSTSAADGPLTVNASASYTGSSSPDTDSVEIIVVANPFVELSISADKQVVGNSEAIDYAVSYGNVGSTGYVVPEIRAQIPTGTAFVSASDGGVVDGNEVVWTIDVLNSGEGGKRYFSVEPVGTPADGQIFSSIVEFATSGGLNLSRAHESVVVRSGVDLVLDVAVTGDVANSGNFALMRYTIANKGSIALTDVNLNIASSERTNFARANTLPGQTGCSFSSCDAGEYGAYPIGTLLAGESRVVTIPLSVFNTAIDGEPLVSHAFLTEGTGAFTVGTKPTLIFDDTRQLELSISASKQVVASGETFEYEVAYGNVNATAYQNLVLEVELPAGSVFVDAEDGGVHSDGIVTWDLGTLDAGEGNKRKVTLTSPSGLADGELLSGVAFLHTGGPSIARASEAAVIRAGVDLTLDVTVTGDVDNSGDFTVYRYVVGNKGSTAVTDVELNIMTADRTSFARANTLPAETACSFSDCVAGEFATYSLGTLPAGETRVVTIPVSNSNTAIDGEVFVNYALVSQGSDAYTLGTKPSVIYDDSRSLELSIAAEKQLVSAGETFTYEIVFGNVNTTAYQNLQLDVELPEGAVFVSASDGGTNNGNLVSWDLDTLDAGVGSKRTVTLQSPASLVDGEVIVSRSTLHTGAQSIARASESVVIRSGVDLLLEVEVIGDVQQPGSFAYYKYLVSNNGITAITDIELKVMTGDRTSFRRAASLPTDTTCSFSDCVAGEFGTYSIGTLLAGESRVVTIPVSASNTAQDGETLVSYVALTEGSGSYTLGTKPSVIYDSSPQVQVVVEADTHNVSPGDIQEFVVKVGNSTSTSIQDSLLTVEIPSGYSVLSASGRNEIVFDTIQWPLGNLPASSWTEETFALTVTSSASEAEALTLSARLDEGLAADKSLARTQVHSIVEERSGINLAVADSFTAPLAPGSAIALDITATNVASSQLADVDLGIMLSNYTGASVSASGATGCSFSTCDGGEWAFWDLGNLDASVSDSRTITPVLYTGGAAASDGYLLIANLSLTHSSDPRHDVVLTRSWGVGPEYIAPLDHDSDEDGIPDWWEIRWGYNRLDPSDATLDEDNDGSDNLEEYTEDSFPNDPDSDDDTILDGPDPFPREDRAPVANAGVDLAVTEGSLVALDATGSNDPDTGALTFNWSQTDGAAVTIDNPTSATASFTAPSVSATETVTLSVEVTDVGGQTDTDSVVITVNEDGIVIVNQPPTADAGADQTVQEATVVTLNGSASSDDDAIAAYVWTQTEGTTVSLSSTTSVTPSFTAPDIISDETLTFSLVVTDNDGALSTADEVNITVTAIIDPVNVPPTADAGIDQTVDEGAAVSLQGTATDEDGTIASYQWSQLSGPTVTLSNADAANASFVAPDVSGDQTLEFSLTVTDNDGATATDEVSILIRDIAVSLENIVVNPNSFARGSGEGVVLSFEIMSNSSDVQVDSLTIVAAGDLNEVDDVNAVNLYIDANNDGVPETSELVSSGAYTIDNGEVSFTFSARALQSGSNAFLITYEF